MKIRYSVKNHIIHNFYIYILAIGATCLAFCYGVSRKAALKDYEMYNVFIAGRLKEDSSIRSFIEENVDQNLKEVHTYAYDPFSFNTYVPSYQALGLKTCDILILPSEKVITEDFYNFIPLIDEFKNDDDFIYEDTHYGYALNDVFSTSIESKEDESYYLFINKNSSHLDKLSDSGVTDSTYQLLKAIQNEKEKE